MLPPCNFTGFKTAPRLQGWVQDGEHWGLWWNGREIAAVHPEAEGIRVRLACRKLWEDKEVRAANVRQGRRYAERWCAARVLPELPLREAVARLVENAPAAEQMSAPPKRTRRQIQQERRLNAVPGPKLD